MKENDMWSVRFAFQRWPCKVWARDEVVRWQTRINNIMRVVYAARTKGSILTNFSTHPT